jgi:HEAT repeat protein
VKNLDGAEHVVRAHAVVALGKLGDKSSVAFLTKDGLTDKSSDVQRSSAIALGLLTDKGDDKTVESLISFSKSAADRGVRNFCLIALGQIGNPKGRDHLVFELKKGHNVHDRTFSALGLGIYGNKCKHRKTEIGKMFLVGCNTTNNDSERGAYAIAMGLLEHKPAAPALIKELEAGGSPNLKGYVATALGLLVEKPAIPLVQELAKRTADLDVQRRASIALGLMQDPDAVKVLVEVIKGAANNLSALGGAAVALGFIGDRSAVDTLAEMLTKTDVYKDNARAFAAVALGVLGDKDDLPLLTKVQESSNYLARTEALGEILTIY